MIYSTDFLDINEEKYTIKIQTNTGNETSSVIPSGNPFVVSYKGDDSNIYKPVRYSGATVGLLTRTGLFDVYAPAAHDTQIILTKNNQIVWTGYATPCIYKQDWDSDLEEIEIEAIDGLSTLKYFKYQAPERTVITFKDLIVKLLSTCECYTEFYFPSNIKYQPGITSRLIEQLKISESNFFDKKDQKKTDEDVAWNCSTVLEELCQYLGVTAIAEGPKVFFLDYDSIKNGINKYYRYSITGEYISEISLSYNHTIQAEDYCGNGTSISLTEVYNKIKIKTQPNKFETVFPDPFDYLTNITASEDYDLAHQSVAAGGIGEVISNNNSLIGGNTNLVALIDRAKNQTNNNLVEKNNFVAVQYCKSDICTLYRYNGLYSSLEYPTSLNYSDTKNFYGCILAKMDVSAMDLYNWNNNDWQSTYDWFVTNKDDYQYQLDCVLKQDGKSKISMSNYIILLDANADLRANDVKLAQSPYVVFNSTDTACLFGGNKSGLVIKGTYIFHEDPTDPYPIPSDQVEIKDGKKKVTESECYLLCMLKWGDNYWDGSNWTTTKSNFHLPWFKKKEEDDLRADKLLFQDIQIPNTVEWRLGTTEEGYYIPSPEQILQGSPEFTIYRQKSPTYQDNKHSHKCVFLKDFSIKAVVGDPTFTELNKTETVYTNVINQSYVSDFKDITFKICTDDNKNPAYSSVAIQLGNRLKFLDKVYNSALSVGEQSWNSASDSLETGMRFEEHLIYRLSNQYSTPTIILNSNIKLNLFNIKGLYHSNTVNKDLIVDEAKLGYRMSSAKINFIEKK